ncbi:MBL fold metallo-hydrolase [Robertkochia aurantiaca]|uniref:MBL fold metallo-hydrolase n=1 Tax=Robertkochia aurantiaca TaxID=2873700 RepID=UPI001CCFBBA8|nr:MBL fold metallo-hydrolase [Robertkochia sp. 3YJGBD-33]
MKITFLGTGTSQGIPVIGSDHPVCRSTDPKDKRLRVSIMVEWGKHRYIVDCGPDFRQQMLTHQVDRIDGILFTHEHADHIMGLDDIRPFFFRQGDIPIYAQERVLQSLRKKFDYVFATENRYPGAPAVKEYRIDKHEPLLLDGMTVIPIEAHHNRLPVLGFRFENFAYLTDIKTIDNEELEKLDGVEYLVLNALREEPHHSHLNIREAIELSEKIGPKETYFTHISHMMGFHSEVQKNLPENVFLAYDNLILNI